MSDRLGLALQLLEVLAEDGAFPGITRGEMRRRLGVAPDTEITARARELRDYPGYGNFDVRVRQDRRDYFYWLPYRERLRAKRFLASWKARKVAA